jgi:hypothetical protein
MHGRVLIPLVAATALLAAPAAQAKAPKLTVMTRNVYLGGNIAGPIPAPDRTASGLWPSDHGGAVMTLRLR